MSEQFDFGLFANGNFDLLATARQSTTIREHLIQRKQPVVCHATANRNTPGVSRAEVKIEVRLWDEFTLDTLNQSFGHVLDAVVSEQLVTPQAHEALAGIVISQDNDISHLIKWNDLMMRSTVEPAQTQLGLNPGLTVLHQSTLIDGPSTIDLPKIRKDTVSHIIYLDDTPIKNLLVAFGRTSRKWSGRKYLMEPKSELVFPFNQLLRICRAAGTRYGYIQTDEEMVVCCFSQDAADQAKVAIMPIPWTRYGRDTLTTDLGLWWLTMLAMSSPGGCGINKEKDTVKINQWVTDLDEERRWVHRHAYSKVEKPLSDDEVISVSALLFTP
jgi:hypothetical protein